MCRFSLVNLVLFCSLRIRLLARLEFGFADCPNCFFFNCNVSHLIPRRRRTDTEEFNSPKLCCDRYRIHVTRSVACALEFRVLSPWSRCLQEQVKLEDEFDFELSIYPDRFLQRSLGILIMLQLYTNIKHTQFSL